MAEQFDYTRALRGKYRFQTSRGSVSVEDLWEFKLDDLDIVAKGINKALKEEEETSFVKPKTKTRAEELEYRLDLLKEIIGVKMAERDAAKEAMEKAERKRKYLEILASKKDEELKGMSIEELEAEIAAL